VRRAKQRVQLEGSISASQISSLHPTRQSVGFLETMQYRVTFHCFRAEPGHEVADNGT
jgi:hypothetical protein